MLAEPSFRLVGPRVAAVVVVSKVMAQVGRADVKFGVSQGEWGHGLGLEETDQGSDVAGTGRGELENCMKERQQ